MSTLVPCTVTSPLTAPPDPSCDFQAQPPCRPQAPSPRAVPHPCTVSRRVALPAEAQGRESHPRPTCPVSHSRTPWPQAPAGGRHVPAGSRLARVPHAVLTQVHSTVLPKQTRTGLGRTQPCHCPGTITLKAGMEATLGPNTNKSHGNTFHETFRSLLLVNRNRLYVCIARVRRTLPSPWGLM